MSLSIYDAKILCITLKKARDKKHLTQATCAELLDYYTSCPKDLEGYRCSPSIEGFYRISRSLNISADSNDHRKSDSTYHTLLRLISQCDDGQLKVLTANANALLETSHNSSEE